MADFPLAPKTICSASIGYGKTTKFSPITQLTGHCPVASGRGGRNLRVIGRWNDTPGNAAGAGGQRSGRTHPLHRARN